MSSQKLGIFNSLSKPFVKLVEKYYPIIDSLITKVNESKDYKLATKKNKNYQFNYFYSSSSKP